MDIVVCIKQVPDNTDVRMNPKTNLMERDRVAGTINPFDRFALEMAVRLKDRYGGTVTAITMGPASAESSLRECYAQGADQLVLITDQCFGGSDTYATAYVLSEAIRTLGHFDMVLCGKQAIDGDTAQVGPELAEQLKIPQLTYVSSVICENDRVQVLRELDRYYERAEAKMPVLLTVVKSKDNVPRYPHFQRILQANHVDVKIIGAAELPELDRTYIGAAGSPTKVYKTFTPTDQRQSYIITEKNPMKAVNDLLSRLEIANIELKEVLTRA